MYPTSGIVVHKHGEMVELAPEFDYSVVKNLLPAPFTENRLPVAKTTTYLKMHLQTLLPQIFSSMTGWTSDIRSSVALGSFSWKVFSRFAVFCVTAVEIIRKSNRVEGQGSGVLSRCCLLLHAENHPRAYGSTSRSGCLLARFWAGVGFATCMHACMHA